MGFGQTGRQIFELASRSDDVEIVAIADIGKREILHYLLCSEVDEPERHTLEGNFLVNDRFRARLMEIDRPAEMPWDIFNVDVVIDSTGKYRDRSEMEGHLANGARRVLLRTLPTDHIDRIVVPGINDGSALVSDKMISAGSATTSALALLLNSLAPAFEIECGNMTSIHSYTSDQALQDYAGSDFRRSRSAAKNIIPNSHEASLWLGKILPEFEGKILTSALNVPVHEGCLLDVTLVMKDGAVSAEDVNDVMRAAATVREASHSNRLRGILQYSDIPVVSSDIIGNSHSSIYDAGFTAVTGDRYLRVLNWYDNEWGYSSRVCDLLAKIDSW
ncbi:UNVERIFIED_CONTAM: hypothetical protein GTU68_058501 [Idotea baltica]|nr:hypothetical protein [Idotea baltica]